MAGLPYRSHRLATARSSPSISTPSLSPLVSFILARPRLLPPSTRKPLVDRPCIPAPRVTFVPQHSWLVASPISRPIPLKLSRHFALIDHFGHTVPLSMAEVVRPLSLASAPTPIIRHISLSRLAPLSRLARPSYLTRLDLLRVLLLPLCHLSLALHPSSLTPYFGSDVARVLLYLKHLTSAEYKERPVAIVSPFSSVCLSQKSGPTAGTRRIKLAKFSSCLVSSRITLPLRSRLSPFAFALAVTVANAADLAFLSPSVTPAGSPPPTNSQGLGSVQRECGMFGSA
ncbi:hypothetical protein EDB86DRAFT_233035, partial [Lactarius hatsudake]